MVLVTTRRIFLAYKEENKTYMTPPKLLLEKTTAKRTLPINIQPDDHYLFASEFSKEIPATRLYALKNVNVTTEGVAIKHFRVYTETLLAPAFKNVFGLKYVLRAFLRLNKISLNEGMCVLAFNHWSKGYFHWVSEVLPRLYAIKDMLRECSILIPRSLNDFQVDSLAPFKYKQIFYIPDNTLVKVKDLVLPTHTAQTGNYNESLIRQVRTFYHEYYINTPSPHLGERIYISRERAKKRKVANEHEVIEVVKKFGFRVINCEDYVFEEKVRIAHAARYLISIYGAALTNILFMNAGAFVFEFRRGGDNHPNCYYSLASALEIRYLYQECSSVNAVRDTHIADLIVDIPLLKKNLDLMLEFDG